MGSPFSIILYANDSARANELARAAFNLVDSFNSIFSDYIDSSELNRLSIAGTDSFATLSPALFDIFVKAEEAWKNTNGKFDISIGALSRLWRKARREKVFPAGESVRNAKELVGWNKVLFDKQNHRIKILQKNMQFDLGGIAAGYIAQKVADFVLQQGGMSALVDASGDIVCTGAPPGKEAWTIGINRPNSANKLLEKNIGIKNCAVSTSGDVYQYIEHNGKKYSHIIDPTTGYGVNLQRNATVIAKDGTTADWMATACCVLPVNKVKKLAKKMKVAFLITQIKNGKLKQYSSHDFKNYWQETN